MTPVLNYLVMELAEGERSLRLKRGKLPIAQAIRFGAQIAEALAVAHARGIVDRDLKPANIMLTKSGVKVLDFGIAKSATDVTLPDRGGFMGTPAYMAPELMEGKDADARADIYSLGAGVIGDAERQAIQTSENLPPALDRVVKRCLETDPDDRWQSARDLKWELESSAQAAVAAPRRSRYAILAGVIGLVVVLLAAIAFMHFRERLPSQPVARMNVLLPEEVARPVARSLFRWPLDCRGSGQGRKAADLASQTRCARLDPFGWDRWRSGSVLVPGQPVHRFFADARLKKIERSGGPVQNLCDALAVLGGTWNQQGRHPDGRSGESAKGL